MTDSKLFLDSSIWLGYFLGNISKTKEIVEAEDNILFTSIISIHEIFRKLHKMSRDTRQAIKFIEENSIVINLNKEIAINSAKNCERYNLHTIDSLIYSSAAEMRTTFVTADTDFRNAPNTEIIKVK